METMKWREVCAKLNINITPEQAAAMDEMESCGQRFCVDFGYENAQRIMNPDYGPMPTTEVLAQAAAFDPTPLKCDCDRCMGLPRCLKPSRERIMRLALETISALCDGYTCGSAETVDQVQRTADQALRECGK